MPESRRPDAESWQDTDQLKANLKHKFVKGSLVTISAQGIVFALQTGATFVLGNLLVPSDFGLIGMVTVVLGFIELLKDLGLSSAIIQSDDITEKQINALFWINTLFGVCITLLFALSAPLLAFLFREARLTQIVIVLSATFVMGGASAVHRALLQREMAFANLARINIGAKFGSTSLAILAALSGLGYWSLVIWRLAQATLDAIGVWWFCRWQPHRPAWEPGTKQLLFFGGNVTGFKISNYFSRSLDNLLIGGVRGAQELGLYAMAYRILLLPVQQINTPLTNVILPTLSRLKDNVPKYQNYYYKSIFMTATVGMMFVGFMYVEIDNLVDVIFGNEWEGITPIFRALGPAALLGTINAADGWAYQSIGNVDRLFRWGLINSSINVVCFSIGINWGAMGIAIAFSISTLLRFVPRFIYCYWGTTLSFWRLVRTLLSPMGATLVAVSSLELISHNISLPVLGGSSILSSTALYLLIYGLTWAILPGKQISYSEIYRLVGK